MKRKIHENIDLQIYNLNKQHKKIAEKLWKIDTPEQVAQFIENLDHKDRRRAITVYNLIILAALDNYNRVDPEVVNLIQDLK